MAKRKELLALLGLVIFMLVMATLTHQDDRGNVADMRPQTALHSIYSNRPSGYKALYLTLEKLGYPVHRQIRPYALLPQRGVLIVGDPYVTSATRYEGRELKAWLRRGNYALMLLEYHPNFLDDLQHNDTAQPAPVELASTRRRLLSQAPKIPASIAQPIRWKAQQGQPEFPFAELPPLTVTSTRRFPTAGTALTQFGMPGQWQPIYADAKGVVASYAPVGRGGIILCCSPWSFSNRGIDAGRNLDVILALAEKRAGGPIIFDEYHHGFGAGMSVWSLTPSPTKLGILQLGGALLLLLITLAWRFGPPRVPADERFSRSRAEYLTSMAGLLQRARATHVVRDRLLAMVQRELTRRLSLPALADNAQLLAANKANPVVAHTELEHVLQQATLLQQQQRPAADTLLRFSRAAHRLLHRPADGRAS